MSKKNIKQSNLKTSKKPEKIQLTSNTALSICPPQYLWPQIQTIRKKYDKAAKRWPPHINLLFPFVYPNNFDEIKQKLEKELKIEPFTLQMNEPSNEVACREKSVWSLPKNKEELHELHHQITKILSIESQFNPHMTFGQVNVNEIDEQLKDIQNLWLELEFEVDEIFFLKKEGENFFVQSSLKLKPFL